MTTKSEFIEKVNKKYGVKRFSIEGEYINNKTKIAIKCLECGNTWEVRPDNFLHEKIGCPKCQRVKQGITQRIPSDAIKERGVKMFGDKYSYEKTDSLNRNKNGEVCFTCNQCGNDFWKTPVYFFSSVNNCPFCYKESIKNNLLKEKEMHENRLKLVHDTDSFIKKLNEKFPNIYDTSKVKYVNTYTPIELIYNNKPIIISPNVILSSKKPIVRDRVFNTEQFIEKASIRHGFIYDYSKVKYINAKTNVDIICKKHGVFSQAPNNHLNGQGCPFCNISKLEQEIMSNIKTEYVQHYKSNWLGLQHLDFYLPQYNIAIECQGEQHYKETNFLGDLQTILQRDLLKSKKCIEQKVNVLYFFNKKVNLNKLLSSKIYNGIYTKNNTFNDIKTLVSYICNLQKLVDTSEFTA